MAIFMTPAWASSWWPSYRELNRMKKDIDRLAREFSGTPFREPGAGVFPLTNVTEDPNNYYVRAELPGVTADELDISVTIDGISISGERKIKAEAKDAKYHRKERDAGTFNRILSLPGQFDPDKVEAFCANGILTVVLPKAQEAKPRQISVKTG